MNLSLTKEETAAVLEYKDHLHRHPETSWHETNTTGYIRDALSKIPHVELLACPLPTGVYARIVGAKPGRTIALRADIDALKCTEESGVSHPSENLGVAHACGHDFHTAGLLGAAMILSRNCDTLCGTVFFLFQPAEETTDGAAAVINTGIFEEYHIDMIFGLHNRPEIPAGKVVLHRGALMAAKKNFIITLHGVGGHGSMPHKCTDPIVCAAAVIEALQTIVSRNTDPLESIVLSIGSIHGGSSENLIVDRVDMTGSIRTFSDDVMTRSMERIQSILVYITKAYECSFDFEIKEQLPALVNTDAMYEIARRAAVTAMGEDAITDSLPCLATEDYSLFLQKVPGFFYWLGSGIAGEPCYSWHNAKFKTDDCAIRLGAGLLAASVFAATP